MPFYKLLVGLNSLLAVVAGTFLLVTIFANITDLQVPAIIIQSVSIFIDLVLSTRLIQHHLACDDGNLHALKSYLLLTIYGVVTLAAYVAIITHYPPNLTLTTLIIYFVSFMLVGYCACLYDNNYEGFDRDFNLAFMFSYSYMTLQPMANLYYLQSPLRYVVLGLGAAGIVLSLGCQALSIILKLKHRTTLTWRDFSARARLMWSAILITITFLAVAQLIFVLTAQPEIRLDLVEDWQRTVSFVIVQSSVILAIAGLVGLYIVYLGMKSFIRRRYGLAATDIEI